MAEAMVKSFRKNAGVYKKCKIIAMSSNGNNPPKETLQVLSELDVIWDETVLNRNPYNGYFNKIEAYAYLEKIVKTRYVLAVDVDVFFFSSSGIKEALKILPKHNLICIKDYTPDYINEEHRVYLEPNLYEKKFLNSGVLLYEPKSGICDLWKNKMKEVLRDDTLLNFYKKNLDISKYLTDEVPLSKAVKDHELRVCVMDIPGIKHYYFFKNLFEESINIPTKEKVSFYKIISKIKCPNVPRS